jgi:hypothetical protein
VQRTFDAILRLVNLSLRLGNCFEFGFAAECYGANATSIVESYFDRTVRMRHSSMESYASSHSFPVSRWETFECASYSLTVSFFSRLLRCFGADTSVASIIWAPRAIALHSQVLAETLEQLVDETCID